MPLRHTVLDTLSARRPTLAGPPDAGTLGQAPMTEGIPALCFPRDDPRFAERVRALLDVAAPVGPLTAAVPALLRAEYPLAVISPRHELAAVDGHDGTLAERIPDPPAIADGETP